MVVFNSLLVGKVKMILSDNGVKDCEHLNGAQTQPGRNIWRQSESQRASQAWTPGAGVRQNWKPKMISLTVTIIPIGIVIILTSDPVCYLWSLSHTSLSVCCCRSSRSHTLQLAPDHWSVGQWSPMLMVRIVVIFVVFVVLVVEFMAMRMALVSQRWLYLNPLESAHHILDCVHAQSEHTRHLGKHMSWIAISYYMVYMVTITSVT